MSDTAQATPFERGGFLLLLVFVTLALIAIAWPFIRPLLWATLAAIMFQPLYRWFLAKRPGKDNQAALATFLVITVAVVIPALFIGSIIVDEVVDLFFRFRDGEIDAVGWFADVIAALPDSIRTQLESAGWTDLDLVRERAQQFAGESLGLIAGRAMAIGSSAFGFVLAFGIALYVMFFLLRDGGRIGPAITAALPLERSTSARLSDRFLAIVRATIKGSIVVGLVQGAIGAVTFAIVGLPSAILFGLLMAIASLLPALGPALVWAPAAIWLFATGAIWEGVAVVVSGVAIIGMADNILRPILVGRDTGIPDWIILVTTLGGIAAFGLSGIVLGPLVAGLFLASWQIAQEGRAPYNPPEEADPA